MGAARHEADPEIVEWMSIDAAEILITQAARNPLEPSTTCQLSQVLCIACPSVNLIHDRKGRRPMRRDGKEVRRIALPREGRAWEVEKWGADDLDLGG